MTFDERKEALARAGAGESHARIARDYGVTRQAISSLVKRGINKMGRPPKIDAAGVTRIRDLRDQGLTWDQIAGVMGISASCARKRSR